MDEKTAANAHSPAPGDPNQAKTDKPKRHISSLPPLVPRMRPPRPKPTFPGPIDPEISRMLNRIQEMRQGLMDKVETLQRQTGIPPEHILAYIKNSKHFDKEKWEAMEKAARELNQKIYASLGWGAEGGQAPAPKTTARLSQERKARMIGARKNWIPIR